MCIYIYPVYIRILAINVVKYRYDICTLIWSKIILYTCNYIYIHVYYLYQFNAHFIFNKKSFKIINTCIFYHHDHVMTFKGLSTIQYRFKYSDFSLQRWSIKKDFRKWSEFNIFPQLMSYISKPKCNKRFNCL